MTKKQMLIKVSELEADAWDILQVYKRIYGANNEMTYRKSGEWLMADRIKEMLEKEVR
jgi:hypothetical protein